MFSNEKKSETFEKKLASKIDFESQIWALFDNPCEGQWNLNRKKWFLVFTYFLAKIHRWGSAKQPHRPQLSYLDGQAE